jgi:organic radical activating enzyme
MEFIKIINTQKIRHVEMRIGNYCNFDCSFCHVDFKSGTRRPLSLELYKKTISNLLIDNTGAKTLITIQGGEPTLYPHIEELVSFIKSNGGYVQMFSNGSRTIRWWSEFLSKKLIDRLIITHHPEQDVSVEHTSEVLNMAYELLPAVSCSVSIVRSIFDEALNHFDLITEKSPNVKVTAIHVINSDLSYNIFDTYTLEQIEIINQRNVVVKNEGFVVDTFFGSTMCQDTTGKLHKTYGQQLLSTNKHKFKGWECDAGIYRIVIETDEAYKAMCRVDGVIGKVSEGSINYSTKPTICQIENCFCGADITVPKRKMGN